MESRKIVFKQTFQVAIGVAIVAALMVGAFALLGYFDRSVLWGAVAGVLLAAVNFFVMSMTATLAAEKAVNQDVKGGQALVQMSYIGRMAFLLIGLVVCGKSGLFNVVALALPLAFVRPVLTFAEFFGKKGDTQV